MSQGITKASIDQFIAKNNPRAITQTGLWLDIEKADNHHAYIIYTVENKEITSSVLLIRQQLPYGKNYLYAPYGPVIKKDIPIDHIPNTIKQLEEEIRRFVDLSNTIFIRLEPFYQDCHLIHQSLQEIGFKITNNFTQPKDTLILNLLMDEETIFKNMKSKTRYNIRLAEKKNVRIQKSTDFNDVKIFYELLQKTCDRNNFKPHNLEHYLNIMKILGPQDHACVYHACYKNKIIASIFVTFFGRVATYLHGASSNTYRNLMPTYALQWQAIRDAIRRECRFYDFGGIAPEGAPESHPWKGITRFKMGFGGIVVSTVGHLEKSISPFWHQAYRIAKYIQK